MEIKIIYEDNNILVIDKPAGVTVFAEKETSEKTLVDHILEKYPELKENLEAPRYGIVHRLDKDTSGVLLTAKNNEALFFLQKQFKTREIDKKYIALVVGDIRDDQKIIETLMGRSKKDGKKQKVYLPGEPGNLGKRIAVTEYKVLEKFENYTLLEVRPKTGRKHQIRCHLAYLGHPLAGDKMYGFKNQPCPQALSRHFLHASEMKIKLPLGEIKEFKSELPDELKKILEKLTKR